MVIELTNIEIYGQCILDIDTGDKLFSREKVINEFAGFYYDGGNHFFALYSTKDGPMMYYRKMQYPLTPDLHIRVNKMDDLREFTIEEYGILIKYKTSPYIGFDVWAEEEDADLFYQIEQNYKKEEYYDKFTKDCFMY